MSCRQWTGLGSLYGRDISTLPEFMLRPRLRPLSIIASRHSITRMVMAVAVSFVWAASAMATCGDYLSMGDDHAAPSYRQSDSVGDDGLHSDSGREDSDDPAPCNGASCRGNSTPPTPPPSITVSLRELGHLVDPVDSLLVCSYWLILDPAMLDLGQTPFELDRPPRA